ncbi:MAG: hypothetical protein WCP12_16825 [bacterium]
MKLRLTFCAASEKYFLGTCSYDLCCGKGRLVFALLVCLAAGTASFAQDKGLEICFAADGLVSRFDKGDGINLIDTAHPGKGFFIRSFTGSAIEDTSLGKVEIKDNVLMVAGVKPVQHFDVKPLPRFTFDVTRKGRYIAFKLNRVEGLPAVSQASLHFEMTCTTRNFKAIPLDYMTRLDQRDTTINVDFNYLWHRNPTDPLGGFALYVATNDAEEDDALLDIWCGEDLPKPAIGEPWTKDRARRWIDDYYNKFKDMTTMILCAGSEAELYTLTDIAEKKGIKMIYLHTDTWRGEYWPLEHSHVHVNEKVFPKGRADLKRYSESLTKRGMNLDLHYTSGGIGPKDPKRIAGHVDRNLAAWGRGVLGKSVDKDAREIKFKPLPGTDIPFSPGRVGNGPGIQWHFFDSNYLRIDEEIIRVGEFADTDKPVWILRNCSRAHGVTIASAHAAGAETVGLLSAFGQNFVPDTDSQLLAEMAREYAQFANDVHLDQLEYDAYEIHGQYSWGPQKFSDLVARHLDHPVVSTTSGGRPVTSNIEMRFSKIRNIGQFGYSTVNLSFQLDDHRPATSIMDAWFEMSSLIAKGVRRFQVLKPEPMFGVSLESLATHGLVDEMFSAFNLWREVLPLLTEEQINAMRMTLSHFGNHMQGKDLFQVRKTGGGYEVIPTRVMVRRQGDVPWKVGQEFGPVGPRQFCQPGQPLELENPFAAQPAGFVIRVLAETDESSTVNSIMPRAKDIHNQRFVQFVQDGDALVMTAENSRAKPVRIEEELPSWRKDFSMVTGRGIAMDIEGDDSGAVVLLQLSGSGTRDYVAQIDFKSNRTIIIPNGEASWADGNWGWRFGAKHFDYSRVHGVSLGYGFIPPKTNPRVRISKLRVLVDVPSKLVNPVIVTGTGKLAVNGEIETGCYLRYDGGDVAAVHDRNWRKLKELKVIRENYVMPSGYAQVRVDVAGGAPRPWMELQMMVTGKPMVVKKEEK